MEWTGTNHKPYSLNPVMLEEGGSRAGPEKKGGVGKRAIYLRSVYIYDE